jgi:hypothetical protein
MTERRPTSTPTTTPTTSRPSAPTTTHTGTTPQPDQQKAKPVVKPKGPSPTHD